MTTRIYAPPRRSSMIHSGAGFPCRTRCWSRNTTLGIPEPILARSTSRGNYLPSTQQLPRVACRLLFEVNVSRSGDEGPGARVLPAEGSESRDRARPSAFHFERPYSPAGTHDVVDLLTMVPPVAHL